ncbi:putative membrane protein [Yarrowia sp. C11]|nr:putative membrane protein [Yarrowia sp. C11]
MSQLWAKWKSRPPKITLVGVEFAWDDLTLKRLVKTFLNTTFCLIFCLIPACVHRIGRVGYMLTLFSVIVPPAKRLGKEVESIVICLLGLGLGIGYANLTRYIAKLPLRHMHYTSEKGLSGNPDYRSALGLLALGEVLMLMFHGYWRSKIPRIFAGVLTFLIVTHFSYLSDLEVSVQNMCINFGYPIMLACGTSLFFNVTIFPESGSTDLGKTTVALIEELKSSISMTVTYFVNSAEIMRAHLEEEEKRENEALEERGSESPKSVHHDHTDDSNESPETYVPESIHDNTLHRNQSAQASVSPELDITELGTLLKKKTTLTAKYTSCKAALTECTFEITYASVSPTVLKPTVKLLNGIVKSAGAMLDACELEFALLGKVQAAQLQRTNSSSNPVVEEEQDIIKRLKPEREIVHGNKDLLLAMVNRVADPVHMLDKAMNDAFDHAVSAVCYAFSVGEQLPNLHDFPDKREEFKDAIETFDVVSRSALASLDFGTVDHDHIDDYLLPRDELFLLASFILNLKSCALSVMSLLEEAQILHTTRRKREDVRGWPLLGKKRLWSAMFDNRKSFSKYFFSRSDDARNDGDNIEGHDVLTFTQNLETREAAITRQMSNTEQPTDLKDAQPAPEKLAKESFYVRFRHQWRKLELWTGTKLANFFEVTPAEEKHWKFALKITIPMFLVSWPMFVPSMRLWYINMRGSWVGFVVALVTETTLGGSVFIFILRTVGLTIGSAWAVLAHTAGRGHIHSVMGVVMAVIFVPALWFMLATKYFKGGMITVVSANVVLLATLYPTTTGGIVTNFAKRTLAMMIGGGAALLGQLFLFPVKAREELVVVTVQAIRECSRMERIIAYGFDDPATAQKEFKKCAKVARGSLTAAATFRTFTKQEPRLKGSFEEISKIFGEIIFVTRQIIDRLENIVFLRQQYGSVVLDEYGPEVLAYRRQTAAAITTTLRAVEAALLNKTPLPQYMPSARLAHRRFVNRVREVMITRLSQNTHHHSIPNIGTPAVGTPLDTPHDTPRETPLGTPLGAPLHPELSSRTSLPNVHTGSPRRHSEGHLGRDTRSSVPDVVVNDSDRPPALHHSSDDSSDSDSSHEIEIVPRVQSQPHDHLQHRAVVLQQKFMSWSATSSAVEEVIEYVEELADLTALLVGVNKFKYGFLSRPIYAEWAASAARAYDEVLTPHDPLKTDYDDEERDETPHELNTAEDHTPGILDRDHIPRGLRKRVFSVVEHNGQLYGGDEHQYNMVPDMPVVDRTASRQSQKSHRSQTAAAHTTSNASMPPLTRRQSIRSVVGAVSDSHEPESKYLTLRRRLGRKINKKH